MTRRTPSLLALLAFLAMSAFTSCDENMAERHKFFCDAEVDMGKKVKVLECMEEGIDEQVKTVWHSCLEKHQPELIGNSEAIIEDFCGTPNEKMKECFKENMHQISEPAIAEIHEVYEGGSPCPLQPRENMGLCDAMVSDWLKRVVAANQIPSRVFASHEVDMDSDP